MQQLLKLKMKAVLDIGLMNLMPFLFAYCFYFIFYLVSFTSSKRSRHAGIFLWSIQSSHYRSE